jgi:hypothetical protein
MLKKVKRVQERDGWRCQKCGLLDIFQVLREFVDRRKWKGTKVGEFLMLGSASMDLMRQSGETLAAYVVLSLPRSLPPKWSRTIPRSQTTSGCGVDFPTLSWPAPKRQL